MKHNRVVSIIFAVLAAIVLILSPVYAEDQKPSELQNAYVPWSVTQMDVSLVGVYDIVWCKQTTGLCLWGDGIYATRIWREPYTDQYSYGCTIWATWVYITDTNPFLITHWKQLETGFLCRGQVRPETDYTPQIGRYGIGEPPYSVNVSASNNGTYSDKWYAGDRIPIQIGYLLPSPNPFLPMVSMDSGEVGGGGSRPIQPTATNPPSKGKKTPTPIPYP